MIDIVLRAFTNEGAAKTYFDNKIVESGEVDGILIKSPAILRFRKDAGNFETLGDGEGLHLVITYPNGTGVSVDSGPPAASAEDD